MSRREFLQRGVAVGVAAGITAGGLLSTPTPAQAEQPVAQETPIGPPWWPSRWGPDDEAGASNYITPEKVLQAARLIRTGKIYELGRVYEQSMPLFGQRVFAMRLLGAPAGGPYGANQLVYNDDFLATEIGQVGTQFDGLGHIGVLVGQPGEKAQMRFYNGFTEEEIASPYGLQKLGIEKVKPIFTRGILLDIAGARGVEMMDMGEEVTLSDVRAALARARIDEGSIAPGDAVFFHTGWGKLWKVDNARYNSGEPGIGLEVIRWIQEKQFCVVGADNWSIEVLPNPDPNLVFIEHNELITKHGIFNHENLDFTELLNDGVYEFVYVYAPLRIKGATGSPGRPIAIT